VFVKSEQVLVIPRAVFEEVGSFQGLRFDAARYLDHFFGSDALRFLPRSVAEEDPGFKQLIPYLIIEHAGQVLHYVRGKKGGESRLAEKGSIGIGGHINDQDVGGVGFDKRAYEMALERELHEELRIDSSYRQAPVAVLNDDSNAVGAVHLGMVHVVHLDAPRVKSAEQVIEALTFLPMEEVMKRHARLETWSQICADHLPELLVASERLLAIP